jgi:hypothetical protein
MIAGAGRKKEHVERVRKSRPEFDPLLTDWRVQICECGLRLSNVGGATVVSPAPLKDM